MQFPCDYCPKICKSKGGRTKHCRSKHVGEMEEGSCSSENSVSITPEDIQSVIRDIGRYLSDENIYKKEQITEVFNLQPSDSFLAAMSKLLSKFTLKKNQDKLLQEFYGLGNANWKEYFHPCSDPKVVFLMLIHLPERLIRFLELADTEIAQPEVLFLL